MALPINVILLDLCTNHELLQQIQQALVNVLLRLATLPVHEFHTLVIIVNPQVIYSRIVPNLQKISVANYTSIFVVSDLLVNPVLVLCPTQVKFHPIIHVLAQLHVTLTDHSLLTMVLKQLIPERVPRLQGQLYANLPVPITPAQNLVNLREPLPISTWLTVHHIAILCPPRLPLSSIQRICCLFLL